MLSPADRALVARDPALPALPVLLDADRLGEWLSQRLGADVRARARYLRYKPGTSCVMAVEVRPAAVPALSGGAPATPDGDTETLLVRAYSAAGAPKLGKSVQLAPAGARLAVDPALLTLVTTPAADRDLPALALLADPSRRERLLTRVLGDHPDAGVRAAVADGTGILRELAYKPHRRWVGALSVAGVEVVLRAYRPQHLRPAVRRVRALQGGAPRTPLLLGRAHRSGLAAVELLPGRAVDTTASPATLAAVGAALTALHARALDLPGRDAPDEAAAVHRAARDVGRLLPERAGDVDRLAAAVGAALDRLEAAPAVTLHGDFSLDQVVLAGSGEVGLIDLDRVGRGAAEIDVASLVAEALVRPGADVRAEDLLGGVLAGYGRRLDHGALSAHLAAQLLRRAAEPFRAGRPDWAADVATVLGLADRFLHAGTRAPGVVT